MSENERPTGKKRSWETTPERGLLRNSHSGQYYYRFSVGGKQKWVRLKTDVYSTAKLRAMDERKEAAGRRKLAPDFLAGKATIGQLMEIYLQEVREDSDLRPSTKVAYETGLKKVKKTWPGIKFLRPQQITPKDVLDWANRFKAKGTSFHVPNTETVRSGNSASSVNRAIDALRHVLDLAVEKGQIYRNPAREKPKKGNLKKSIEKKKLVLPSRVDLDRIIESMRQAGQRGGWGTEAAYLCRFLRCTGARIGEVPRTTWSCVNRERNELDLPGYKTIAAERSLPQFEELKVLLEEILKWRQSTAVYREDRDPRIGANDPIILIRECQKTVDAACLATGVQRITHHDWRHAFATSCVESDVDFLTISKWLGHSDGGTLVQRTYGHLRNEHSHASAQKVTFGAAPKSQK
jgi:integrase